MVSITGYAADLKKLLGDGLALLANQPIKGVVHKLGCLDSSDTDTSYLCRRLDEGMRLDRSDQIDASLRETQ